MHRGQKNTFCFVLERTLIDVIDFLQSSGLLEFCNFFQGIRDVVGGVYKAFINVQDFACLVYHVAFATIREAKQSTSNTEQFPNFSVWVAQEVERELVFFDEVSVGVNRVCTDADNLCVGLGKLFVQVPELANLVGTPVREVCRIEENHKVVALAASKGVLPNELLSRLVSKGKLWNCVAYTEFFGGTHFLAGCGCVARVVCGRVVGQLSGKRRKGRWRGQVRL